MDTTKPNTLAIPIAIIIAGLLIAGAVYLGGKGTPSAPSTNTGTTNQPSAVNLKPVTSSDHILGNPKAKVVMVEYSDLECPYCKAFQNSLHQIMDTYGANGDVAWVYRHFTVHSKAPYEAQASECVAELGGNDKFFAFIDKIFQVTKSDNNLDPKVLTQTAVSLGIDQAKFQSCLDSGKYANLVNQETQDAIAAGGQGTPYTILVTKNGTYPINEGAIPFSDLKSRIDTLLAGLK